MASLNGHYVTHVLTHNANRWAQLCRTLLVIVFPFGPTGNSADKRLVGRSQPAGGLSEGRVVVGAGKILPLDQTVDFGLAHGYALFDRVAIQQLVLHGRLPIEMPTLPQPRFSHSTAGIAG